MFTIYILDVKVRAWGSLSKPFGFLLGPHIILQNQLTFSTGEEPLKGAENIIKLIDILNLQMNKPYYD